MKVANDRVVTLEYKLSTDTGLIESSVGRGAPVAFIHGRGFMLPGLDSKLDGMEVGERKAFDLQPAEAFGTVEDQQTKRMAKSDFPDEAAVTKGSKFQAKVPGSEMQITLEVLEDHGDEADVRLVHPYAGRVIQCEVTVVGVRSASPRELSTGVVETVAAAAPAGAAPPPPPNVNPDSLEEVDLDPDPD
jgi:FKBP-type peptidyl-prolyl cis-trans isomerase SlyD